MQPLLQRWDFLRLLLIQTTVQGVRQSVEAVDLRDGFPQKEGQRSRCFFWHRVCRGFAGQGVGWVNEVFSLVLKVF